MGVEGAGNNESSILNVGTGFKVMRNVALNLARVMICNICDIRFGRKEHVVALTCFQTHLDQFRDALIAHVTFN